MWGNPEGNFVPKINKIESQKCPECKTERIKHETKEEEEYAICLECGWKFDIDYTLPF